MDHASLEIYVLNYNGRRIMAECLPSVVEAQSRSRHEPRVIVVDNGSGDGSREWLGQRFPAVEVRQFANRGLCSFNEAVVDSSAAVAVLLNSDIRLEPDAIDLLAEPLMRCQRRFDPDCFLTAARCIEPRSGLYDGQRTAVRWRCGLVQATSQFPGHESGIRHAGWTSSAGAAIAVRLDRFRALGGFDSLFLPGRLEDLDLSYRGFLAGWHARYVPEAVAYHLGQATYRACFDDETLRLLDLRNTLLFQWKNFRDPGAWARWISGYGVRLATDCLSAALGRGTRCRHARALIAAAARWRQAKPGDSETLPRIRNRAAFFDRFGFAAMRREAARARRQCPTTAVSTGRRQAELIA